MSVNIRDLDFAYLTADGMEALKWHGYFYLIWSLLIVGSLNAARVDITQHPSWLLLEHDKCGNSNSDRIIGGKNATMGAYPWIARIGYSSAENKAELTYRCGGTLINKFYVVTAGHCVSNLPEKFKVGGIRLGEHNTQTNPDCETGYCAEPVQDFTPEQIIVHKNYGSPAFKNDIAIIRLNRPANYNEGVMPICLPRAEILDKDFVGQKAEVAGWGIFDINDPKGSVILQTVKLPIVATERCKKAFKLHAEIGEEQICVGGEIGSDSCGGDSGGPLMKVEVLDGPPRYYFIGVVSFGAKHCGESATPAVYSRISHYLSWLLDNVSP